MASDRAPMVPFELPTPSGTHPVGVIDFVIEDPSVPEPFGPGHRRLPARAFYPAAARDGPVRAYRTELEAASVGPPLAATLMLTPDAFSRMNTMTTHAQLDAPAAALSDAAPLVLFTPGFYGWLDTNTALMERLASLGCVAVAVAHTYEASATVYPDGTVLPLDEAAKQRTPAEVSALLRPTYTTKDYSVMENAYREAYKKPFRLAQSATLWRDDMLRAARALVEGRGPAALPRVDATRVAFIGHSYGGPAAVAAGHRMEGCRAAINLDGRDYGFEFMGAGVSKPVLLLYQDPPAELGTTLMYDDLHYEAWAEAGDVEKVARFVVTGAGHWDFTDYTLADAAALPATTIGPAHGAAMLERVNALVVAFLGKHGVISGAPEPFGDAVTRVGGLRAQDLSGLRAWAASRAV